MKFAVHTISKWRIWTLSGRWAFLIMFLTWFGLGWIFGPISNTAYALSILVAFIGPTAVFGFLFIRHWMLRAEYSDRDGLSRRLGCIVACGVTTWLAVETADLYNSMSDAPRGMVWDFNVCFSPLLGMAATLIVRPLIYPRSMWQRNQAQ